MKSLKWKLAAVMSCVSGALMLASCGTSNTNCQSGYVYGGTAYGCQPQGSCPSGEFQVSGTGSCLSASNTAATSATSCYTGYTYYSQYNACCMQNPAQYGTGTCTQPITTGTNGYTCQSGCTYYAQYGACYSAAGQYCGAATTTGTGTTGACSQYQCTTAYGQLGYQTSQGCLPQYSGCPSCSAWNGSSCVQAL